MSDLNWGLAAIVVLTAVMGLCYLRFERKSVSSKDLALLSALTALTALGRVPFAAIPSVQPTTFMVTYAGFVFGPQTGFLVGSLAALLSNFFLGQGPWTLWQMAAWGLVGVTAGMLGRCKPDLGKWGLGLFGVIWGYLFGWIMNLSYWLVFVYPLTLKSFLTAYAASFYFDTLHAAGNLAFTVALGPMVKKIMVRYRERLRINHLARE
ncbi:MAG: ECF transporter S component [Syntrophomonadaceae bacterium]|nr:ECF transporter S component [Syntrophomonadaceae bacterium]